MEVKWSTTFDNVLTGKNVKTRELDNIDDERSSARESVIEGII